MHDKYKNLIKKTSANFEKLSAKFLLTAVTLDTLLANSAVAYSTEIPENSLEHSLLLKTSAYLTTGVILLTLSYFLKKDNQTTRLAFRVSGIGCTLAGVIYGLAYLYK